MALPNVPVIQHGSQVRETVECGFYDLLPGFGYGRFKRGINIRGLDLAYPQARESSVRSSL